MSDRPGATGLDRGVPDVMAAIRPGRLRMTARTEAIVLLLHGGRAEEPQPHAWRDVSWLRMLPFARAVRRAGRGRLATLLVHNTDGGWVAASGSGVLQCRELVRRLQAEHGLPVVLLGHSSGGWVALRVGGDPGVAGVVALAPWVAEDEGVDHLVGTPVRVAHGDADTVCSPTRAAAFVDRLRAVGGDAVYRSVPKGDHALLRHPTRWHHLAAAAVQDVLPAGEGSVQAGTAVSTTLSR